MEQLCIQPLEQRRKTRCISLLLKILAKEEHHPALSFTYEDLLSQLTTGTVQTRSQARGQPRSAGTNGTGTRAAFSQGQSGTWRLDSTKTMARSSLELRSLHRNNRSSCSVDVSQLLFVIWLLSNNCSNYYPYAVHPFLPLVWRSLWVSRVSQLWSVGRRAIVRGKTPWD